MSEKSTYTIQCPQCEAEQEVTLYDSINLLEAPALRDALMANQLNAVSCPHCGLVFRVDKQLLYHDPERRLMIFWFPGNEEAYRTNRDEFLRSMNALQTVLPDDFEPPTVHLVFTRTELVERIYLLEADLEERIIEYIKYMMHSRNMDRLDPRRKAILFNAEDSTEQSLCFITQDLETMQLESMMEFDRQAYDGLLEMFEDDAQATRLQELFPGPYISARALLIQNEDDAQQE